jgi:hypothetical protein
VAHGRRRVANRKRGGIFTLATPSSVATSTAQPSSHSASETGTSASISAPSRL